MARIKVKCPLCNFETDNVHTLFGHMLSTHCDDEGYFVIHEEKKQEQKEEKVYYQCQFCGARFESLEEARKHVLTEHKKELEELQKKLEKKSKRKKKTEK